MDHFRFALVLLTFIFTHEMNAQSLIINEVSNGPAGNQEYVEFVVVSNTVTYNCNSNTPPCIDIRGWIIDDNSGYHGGTVGTGVAPGAVRFTNDAFWSCIPLGTIILVYNNIDPNTSLPATDLSMSDGNCRLVIPINNTTLFESNLTTPGAIACSYPTTGWTAGGNWNNTVLANSGDCMRIVDLAGCEVFSLCYGSANTNNLIYFTGPGGDQVWYFSDGNPALQANWSAGCADPVACGSNVQTPGSPNNAQNAAYIGQFNNACQPITPVSIALVNTLPSGCLCDGSATVAGGGSIGPYTYEWISSAGAVIGTTSSMSNLCAGSYQVVVESSIGCTDTLLVTIGANAGLVTPTFTQVAPICSGGTITLPTTATNGFTGTWSPAINNTATTTYTFTPTAGQCATTATMSVTVDPNITPTFTQVAPICNGGTFTLPTTSTNTINGTWSPAINNTATTTYTFTPTAGQCATTAPMTVTVNQPITPTFTQVIGICSGGTFTLPSTSNNAINGSWSPAINNTATTTYTFTPTAGQCAATATMTVTVSSPTTPTFTQVAPICNGGAFTLPATSNNAINGTWSPAVNNTATTLYTFTPTAGQCANTSTMTVTVNSLPVIDMSTVAVSNENCNQSDGSIGGIQVNGGTPNYQYGWNTTPPSTTLSISGLSDGMYQLVVTDANGCLSTISVPVGSNPAPQIDATGLNVTQPTCVDGGSISGITASGSAPLTYSWTGTSQTGSTLSNLQAGSYALTVTDAAGCTAQYGPIVLVNPVLPQADFTWTPTTPDVNTTVTFTDNSTGNGIVTYQWQIDGQAASGQQVQTAFTAGGTYTIVLTITDANGCVDDTMQLITVLSEIQVPNVITANGDGVNDLFIIDGLTENTTLTILNRWGNVVFTTDNYQNNWNGRDTSGQELTEGVYTYIYKTTYQQTGHGFIHVIH